MAAPGEFWFEGYTNGKTIHYRIVFANGLWGAVRIDLDSPLTGDDVLDAHEYLVKTDKLPTGIGAP